MLDELKRKLPILRNNIILFIICLCVAGLLIMAIVYLLFLVSRPQEAHVYVELDNLRETAVINALETQIYFKPLDNLKEVECNKLASQEVKVDSKSKIEMYLENATINDDSLRDGVDHFELIPNEEIASKVSWAFSVTNTDRLSCTHQKNSYTNSVTEIQFNDLYKSVPSAYVRSGQISLYFSDNMDIDFNNCQSIICVYTDGKREELSPPKTLSIKQHLADKDKEHESCMRMTVSEKDELRAYYSSKDGFTLQTNSCYAAYTQGRGTASLSYRLNPEESKLKDEIIALSVLSKDELTSFKELRHIVNDSHSCLTISMDAKNGTFEASGMVKGADISNISLFPDFFSWYYSNIYLVPFQVVSIAISASALMNKCEEKERKEKA